MLKLLLCYESAGSDISPHDRVGFRAYLRFREGKGV
jgi:hypothetical protein